MTGVGSAFLIVGMGESIGIYGRDVMREGDAPTPEGRLRIVYIVPSMLVPDDAGVPSLIMEFAPLQAFESAGGNPFKGFPPLPPLPRHSWTAPGHRTRGCWRGKTSYPSLSDHQKTWPPTDAPCLFLLSCFPHDKPTSSTIMTIKPSIVARVMMDLRGFR